MNTRLITPRSMVLALVGASLVGGASVEALNLSRAHAASTIASIASGAISLTPVVALADHSQIVALNGAAVDNIRMTGMVKTTALLIQRDGSRIFVPVRVG